MNASWFQEAIVAGDASERFGNAKDCLASGETLEPLKIHSWRQHLCFEDGNLSQSQDRTLLGAFTAFFVSVLISTSWRESLGNIPKEVKFDGLQYYPGRGKIIGAASCAGSIIGGVITRSNRCCWQGVALCKNCNCASTFVNWKLLACTVGRLSYALSIKLEWRKDLRYIINVQRRTTY